MKDFNKKTKEKWWALKLWWARFFYGNPAQKLKIVGVTGTNGKTTTTTLLYQSVKMLGCKAGLIGTVNILIDGKEWKPTGRVPSTTPDSVTLTKIFHAMVKAGCEYVFMEVSSHAVAQNRIAGIDFAGGVFTNLTQDHLDYHKSFENYFIAKQKFFAGLSKESFALSNDDDEHGEAMIGTTLARQLFYGIEANTADFKGEVVSIGFSGIVMKINGEVVRSKLIGKFNAYNILAVYGTLLLLGFDKEKVLSVLAQVTPPIGRFDYFISNNGVVGVVDYAHSPDAVEKIIQAVRAVMSTEGRLITVLGCGGDRDTLKRRVMGKTAVHKSDFAILTSDNPRNEDPEKILTEMKVDLTMSELEKTKTITDRRDAIKTAVDMAKPNDVILVAGKGHETYQEIKGHKHHFNDMEELQKLL